MYYTKRNCLCFYSHAVHVALVARCIVSTMINSTRCKEATVSTYAMLYVYRPSSELRIGLYLFYFTNCMYILISDVYEWPLYCKKTVCSHKSIYFSRPTLAHCIVSQASSISPSVFAWPVAGSVRDYLYSVSSNS